MNTNVLSHQVDARILEAVGTGDFAGRLVDLVVLERGLGQRGLGGISQGPVVEHQVVVGFPVLGVDGERLRVCFDGRLVLLVQIQGASELPPGGPVFGEGFEDVAVGVGGILVEAIFLAREAPDPCHAWVADFDGLALVEVFVDAGEVAVLERRFGQVERTVNTGWRELGHAGEGAGGAAGVVFEQEADAVVVEPDPGCRVHVAGGDGTQRGDGQLRWLHDRQRHGVRGDFRDREVGHGVKGRETRRIGVVGELRVGPVELAPEEPGTDGEGAAGQRLGDAECVVGEVGSAGSDHVGVDGRVDVLRVAHLDRVRVFIHHDRFERMGHGIQMPVGPDGAADGEGSAGVIGDGELQPALVRVVGAAREGVPHALVADDDIHHDLFPGRQRGQGAGDIHDRLGVRGARDSEYLDA